MGEKRKGSEKVTQRYIITLVACRDVCHQSLSVTPASSYRADQSYVCAVIEREHTKTH